MFNDVFNKVFIVLVCIVLSTMGAYIAWYLIDPPILDLFLGICVGGVITQLLMIGFSKK